MSAGESLAVKAARLAGNLGDGAGALLDSLPAETSFTFADTGFDGYAPVEIPDSGFWLLLATLTVIVVADTHEHDRKIRARARVTDGVSTQYGVSVAEAVLAATEDTFIVNVPAVTAVVRATGPTTVYAQVDFPNAADWPTGPHSWTPAFGSETVTGVANTTGLWLRSA